MGWGRCASSKRRPSFSKVDTVSQNDRLCNSMGCGVCVRGAALDMCVRAGHGVGLLNMSVRVGHVRVGQVSTGTSTNLCVSESAVSESAVQIYVCPSQRVCVRVSAHPSQREPAGVCVSESASQRAVRHEHGHEFMCVRISDVCPSQRSSRAGRQVGTGTSTNLCVSESTSESTRMCVRVSDKHGPEFMCVRVSGPNLCVSESAMCVRVSGPEFMCVRVSARVSPRMCVRVSANLCVSESAVQIYVCPNQRCVCVSESARIYVCPSQRSKFMCVRISDVCPSQRCPSQRVSESASESAVQRVESGSWVCPSRACVSGVDSDRDGQRRKRQQVSG